MKYGAAASLAVRVDKVAYRGVEPGLAQRLDNETAFPLAIARKIPVLGLAPAAHAKVRAYRCDPLRAFALDTQQMAAVGMPGKCLYLHCFAGKRVRNKQRPVRRIGNAIAAMADARDDEAFNHAGLLAEIRDCPRRPRSATE